MKLKIRNKTTGEIKWIDEKDAPLYGVSLPTEEKQESLIGAVTDILLPSTKKYFTKTAPEFHKKVGEAYQTGGLKEAYKTQLKELPKLTKEGIGPVLELLSLYSAGKGVKTVVTKGPKYLFKPRATIGRLRKQAASQVKKKIPSDKIIAAGKKYLRQDPMASRYKPVLDSLKGKKLTVSELLRRLKIWNKAYTAAGQVGKSSKAGFYNALANTARKELQKVAPEVAKYNRIFELSYKAPKMTRKALWQAASIAGLLKLLGVLR